MCTNTQFRIKESCTLISGIKACNIFLDDWYCPVSDSQGFRFLLHNPLEIPQVEDFASLIELNKEVLVEIHPEMTTADVDIRSFKMVSIKV